MQTLPDVSSTTIETIDCGLDSPRQVMVDEFSTNLTNTNCQDSMVIKITKDEKTYDKRGEKGRTVKRKSHEKVKLSPRGEKSHPRSSSTTSPKTRHSHNSNGDRSNFLNRIQSNDQFALHSLRKIAPKDLAKIAKICGIYSSSIVATVDDIFTEIDETNHLWWANFIWEVTLLRRERINLNLISLSNPAITSTNSLQTTTTNTTVTTSSTFNTMLSKYSQRKTKFEELEIQELWEQISELRQLLLSRAMSNNKQYVIIKRKKMIKNSCLYSPLPLSPYS
eukprot:TRINITY_DN10693_c0_g1_i6.p1 TRINITY_DN10693_c0_g1~~TRINITY_DN10693_c0_g1_i6.p1  ORF type:complete len:279 (-),score=26.70 TRINITY_DN10693_c0_g1_i6:344-1180(-)